VTRRVKYEVTWYVEIRWFGMESARSVIPATSKVG